jgi:precorrin-2/cobalt-factor-2 C20-methyltransferase
MALGIIGKAVGLEGKRILEIHFPMVRDLSPEALRPAAQSILDAAKAGSGVAFVTLGDPSIYSTFFRLREALLLIEPALEVEVVPGITAITAAAARAGRGLALSGEKIAIVPATYCAGGLKDILEKFECVALMKVHSVFPEVKRVLEESGRIDNALYVCRAGLDGETIKPVAGVEEKDLDYFSTVIVRGAGERPPEEKANRGR